MNEILKMPWANSALTKTDSLLDSKAWQLERGAQNDNPLQM